MILKMILAQGVQAFTDFCQHLLNICTVLNYVTVLKFDIFQ